MTELIEKRTLLSRVIKTELIRWKDLKFIQSDDFKELTPEASKKLIASMLANNFSQPFYVWQDECDATIYCLDGKHRIDILKSLESAGDDIPELLPATFMSCRNKKEAANLVLLYSSMYAKITEEGFMGFINDNDLNFEELQETIDLPDFDEISFKGLLNTTVDATEKMMPQSLTERFIVPPFSILDSRQGYWQDRKKDWHSLFDSQETREDIELVAKSGQAPAIYQLRNTMREALGREPEWDEIIAYAKKKGMHIYSGASIFDPVLCEICYTWFCPVKASILDPFAGGSVRGIVASILGHDYVGIDLRPEQCDANIQQRDKLNLKQAPSWLAGDSNTVLDSDLLKNSLFDFLFSCPPYHDLEQYSNDPADLSNMSYDNFLEVYKSIIIKSVGQLKNNRFAAFIVANIRDEKGIYRNFVNDTIEAFQSAGMQYYNEIILINVAGSLPVRVGRQFDSGRKVGKMHQNVLVFYKGDPKAIKEEFPELNTVKDLQTLNYQPNIALSIVDD